MTPDSVTVRTRPRAWDLTKNQPLGKTPLDSVLTVVSELFLKIGKTTVNF